MANYETIVIKIGSSTLTNKLGKLDLVNLRRLVSEIASLKQNVIVVTSGSIVTGAERLGHKEKSKSLPHKQAAAAVGQSILMSQYDKAFSKFRTTVAQILLTKDEITNGERRSNAINTLQTLLSENVVPIVNENDTVSVDEIRVGDNDTLSAYVATMIKADLLILLSDIDGFYMETEEGVDYKVGEVSEITKEVEDAAGHPGTQLGVGGMITKIQAAKIVTAEGIPMVIADGRKKGALLKIVSGETEGTIFLPRKNK